METLSEKLYCQRCKRHTNHHTLSKDNVSLTYTISSSYYDDYHFHDEYHIVQCLGCDNVCFANVYSGDDCQAVDENGHLFYDTAYTVYPEEPKREVVNKKIFHQVINFTNVPTFINQVYHEVVAAVNTGANLLPAAGLRTIVEAICKDIEVSDGFVYNEDGTHMEKNGGRVRSNKLQGKINGLQELGVITLPQRNILHQVRKLGNYAVHEIEFPKRRTISLGIEIIEKTLENIYELDKYDLAITK